MAAAFYFGDLMKFGKLLAAAVGVSFALCAVPSASALGTEDYTGSIGLTAATYCPKGSVEPQGQLLPVRHYQALFALIGTTFGGDGTKDFALPDLRDSATAGLRFCIVIDGRYPARD